VRARCGGAKQKPEFAFPHPNDWRRPQPIHARAETIDTTKAFADAFHDGQRCIVIFKTFNEGKVLESGKTEQYTITMNDQQAAGFALLNRPEFTPNGENRRFPRAMTRGNGRFRGDQTDSNLQYWRLWPREPRWFGIACHRKQAWFEHLQWKRFFDILRVPKNVRYWQ